MMAPRDPGCIRLEFSYVLLFALVLLYLVLWWFVTSDDDWGQKPSNIGA
jgi:hypothetical protein